IVPTEGQHAGKIMEVIINEPGEGITNNLEGPSLTCNAPPSGGVQAKFSLQIGIAKNPVVAAMQSIAPRLRAVIIADGPSTTDEAVVQYRGDYGDKRVYIVDPKVTI